MGRDDTSACILLLCELMHFKCGTHRFPLSHFLPWQQFYWETFLLPVLFRLLRMMFTAVTQFSANQPNAKLLFAFEILSLSLVS